MLVYLYDCTLIPDIYRDKTKLRTMLTAMDAKSLARLSAEEDRTWNDNNYGAVVVNGDKIHVVAVFVHMTTG
jgi:hypothetical protein